MKYKIDRDFEQIIKIRKDGKYRVIDADCGGRSDYSGPIYEYMTGDEPSCRLEITLLYPTLKGL